MSDHTTVDSESVKEAVPQHHQHHHAPSIVLPPMEGIFDSESMKALATVRYSSSSVFLKFTNVSSLLEAFTLVILQRVSLLKTTIWMIWAFLK